MSAADSVSEETIFSAALLTPPAERAAYLDQACAGQSALRERIEQLLRAQPDLGNFMEVLAHPTTKLSLEPIGFTDASSAELGTRIDHYRLLQLIGEGGCGVVYLAEQERPVRREVALKLIKLGMDTRNVIARFEAERQALALMEHPNIAKVFDAGATTTGRPYFVMELVRGVKITTYCDRHRLATRERLQLFLQACHAVQHAHQKGIIHRDLKPSNILVAEPISGGAPSLKVIDFGIAKATVGRLTDQTVFTALGQFLGTPAYMSPEQVLGPTDDIDTRSDIYSLGVLLYELLTGSTPFDTQVLLSAGLEELRRTIREVEPPTPSTRLTQALTIESKRPLSESTGPNLGAAESEPDLRRRLHEIQGDLDWIVMKCLEKDRMRRYATANALAMDLERHLSHEPVLARPPSRFYEFTKTVRRHRVGFLATAAVMIALATGIWVSALQAQRARRAELQARQTAYIADMELANRALNAGDLGTAQAYLRRYQPKPGDPDLRGWEWRYLTSQSNGESHTSLDAHSSWVWGLRFVDDDSLLTTGGADWRTIRWSIRERRPTTIVTNLNQYGGVSSLFVMSPRRNAAFYRSAWSRSSRLRVVDFQAGTDHSLRDAKGELLEVGNPIVSLDISPDQEALAVAFANQVGIWDLDRKIWQKRFKTESSSATCGFFSPDGQTLLVAEESGQVALWNLADDRRLGLFSLSASGSPASALSLSKDGRWLVHAGGQRPTQIWNLKDWSLVAELSDSNVIERAVLSPDGRWLATAGGDTSVQLWNTATWHKSRKLRGHTDPVLALAFSPDGSHLATGARNGEVKLWPLNAPPPPPAAVQLPAANYFQVARDGSGFGRVLRTEQSNGKAAWSAELWTASPLQKTLTVSLPAGPPSSGVVLAGARGLVLGGFDGALRCFGPAFGNATILSNAHAGEIYLTDASLDGLTLVTKAMADNAAPEDRVCAWRLPRLDRIAELPRAESVHGIGISGDGRWLAGFTGPGDIGIWEISSMQGPPMWRGLATHLRVPVCAFSSDNRWLAGAPIDGGAYLWNLETHRRIVLPRALTEYTSLSFSPDNSRLVAGSDGESRLFDALAGQVILSFQAPGLKLAFNPDGKNLLAVQADGASVLHAPAFEELRFPWLNQQPSEEPPAFPGPDPDYDRPGQPQSSRKNR